MRPRSTRRRSKLRPSASTARNARQTGPQENVPHIRTSAAVPLDVVASGPRPSRINQANPPTAKSQNSSTERKATAAKLRAGDLKRRVLIRDLA